MVTLATQHFVQDFVAVFKTGRSREHGVKIVFVIVMKIERGGESSDNTVTTVWFEAAKRGEHESLAQAYVLLSFSFGLRLSLSGQQIPAAATADGSIFSSQLRELCNHVLAASLTTLSHSFLLQSGSFKLLVLLGIPYMKYGLWTVKFICRVATTAETRHAKAWARRVSKSGACDRLSTIHKPFFPTFPPSSVPPPCPPPTTWLLAVHIPPPAQALVRTSHPAMIPFPVGKKSTPQTLLVGASGSYVSPEPQWPLGESALHRL